MDRSSLFLRDPSRANMIAETSWIVAVYFYIDPSTANMIVEASGS